MRISDWSSDVCSSDLDLVQELDLEGYRNLQAAVSWVYEDIASTEQRHALFAAEFARSVSREEPIGKAFWAAGRDVLEGSRLAFQLSQSNLRSEEHTSELQSLMRLSYAVFCLQKNTNNIENDTSQSYTRTRTST